MSDSLLSPSTNANAASPPATPTPVRPDEREQVLAILDELSTELIELGPSLSASGIGLWREIRDMLKRSPEHIVWEDVRSIVSIWRQIRASKSSRLPESEGNIAGLERLTDSLKLSFGYPEVKEAERDKNRNRTLELMWRGRKCQEGNPTSEEEDLDVVGISCCIPAYKTPAECRRSVEKTTSDYFKEVNPPSEMLWSYLRNVRQKIDILKKGEPGSIAGASGKELEKSYTTVYETLQESLRSNLSDRQQPFSVVDASVQAEYDLGFSNGVPRLSKSESSQVVHALQQLLIPSIKRIVPCGEGATETLAGRSGSGARALVKILKEWLDNTEQGIIYNLLHHKRRGSIAEGEDFLDLSRLTAQLWDVRLYANKGLGRSFRALMNLHRTGKLGGTLSNRELEEASRSIISGLNIIHGIATARNEMTFSVKVFEDGDVPSRHTDRLVEVPERFASLTFHCHSTPSAASTAFSKVDASTEKVGQIVNSLVSGYQDSGNSLLESRFLALADQIGRWQPSPSLGALETKQMADNTIEDGRSLDRSSAVHTLLRRIQSALSTSPLSRPLTQNYSGKRQFESTVASSGSSSATSRCVARLRMSALAIRY
jgi:hypothetical protein